MSNAELAQLSELIGLIYEGATDPNHWNNVLPAIADWLGAPRGLLFTPLNSPKDGGFYFNHAIPEHVMQLWGTKYQPHDIWAIRAVERNLMFEGNVINGDEVVSFEELITTTLLSGCATPLAPPSSRESSMAIIQPIVSGSMRVGLAFNTYSYHEKPSNIEFMNNQNRVICPDVKNKSSGEVIHASSVLTTSLTPQCYYPNLTAGTYTFNDYTFNRPGETYKVLLVTLSKTLFFHNEEMKFNIGSGEVKHLGKYVISFKEADGNLAVTRVDKLDARESITQAKLDLQRAESPWKLK